MLDSEFKMHYNKIRKREFVIHFFNKKGAVILRKKLIALRKNKNLTQVEIAKKLGISTRHYKSLEAGTSNGSIKIWSKLKDILNAETIDFLLEQEDDNTNTNLIDKE